MRLPRKSGKLNMSFCLKKERQTLKVALPLKNQPRLHDTETREYARPSFSSRGFVVGPGPFCSSGGGESGNKSK